ncbi:MAG: ATP-binding domain-containing protein, partial [Cyanobacteria bacterium NC_groundwater_1444_Ag_S-0.65um_54_12]|nr:ATP-binding domain-containing protein [Cyanobacteria bacterium NC_groundwater_1444_Ag_S-0.65um_54_12]
EVSMLDLLLTNHIFKSLPPGAQLLMVGDADQLPSVGPGAVLRDMLTAGKVPAVRLSHIFRQAQASLIVMNAHRINLGKFPRLLPPVAEYRSENAFFIEQADPEQIIATTLDLLVRRLPARGYRPEDIQLLCPMNRGSLGATALNTRIQQVLNPARADQPVALHGNRRLQVGDRVIQLRNNYHYEVFNGETGTIVQIDPEEQELTVEFPEKRVCYDFSDQSELGLAYAMSVHKAQGSEYAVVIIPLTLQHYPMLQRNLLYTAVTRARQLLIIIGSKRAVSLAVRNDRLVKRHSHLAERLLE